MMLVNRITHIVKRGCMEEALALLKAEGDRYTRPRNYNHRLYRPHIGHSDVLAFEIEFESMEDHKKFWDEYSARSETTEVTEKYNKLVEPGTTTEIWTLVE